MENPKILSLKDIKKSYPGTVALKGINIDFRKGEIHSVVGENGAGKSTMVKLIYGLETPTSGDFLMNGQKITVNSPLVALQQHGIAVVPQERQINPELTVAENIVLGRIPTYGKPSQNVLKIVHRKSMLSIAEQALVNVGAGFIDPELPAKKLSVSEQQIVEIARALTWNPPILLLDEPTATLGEEETKVILKLLLNLKKNGTSIIFISHRLDEVLEISDWVTVLRDGECVNSLPVKNLQSDDIVRMMTGMDKDLNLKKDERISRTSRGEPLLRVRNLSQSNKYRDISLDLYKGEIVGLAGLIGSGRSDILHSIFGLSGYDQGEMLWEGNKVSGFTPQSAMKYGIGFIPADRKREGIIPTMDVEDNLTISYFDRLSNKGVVNQTEKRNICDRFVKMLQIKLPGLTSPITSLSGGNQQKVVLSRILMREPKLLLIDEPTQGIDVGARYEVHQILRKFAAGGGTVFFVSSDMNEMIDLSDRIIVLDRGKIVDELDASTATSDKILSLCHGLVS